MRIRRRPQPTLQLGSDPTTSTAPPTPQQKAARSRGWLEAGGGEDREARVEDDAGAADLGRKPEVARRLTLPQDVDDGNVVVVDRGGSGGAKHGGGDDGGHMRFVSAVSNGYHHSLDQEGSVACVGGKSEQAVASKPEEPVTTTTSNGALQSTLPPVAVKDGEKASGNGGGAKKRRGPAVILEGSRCSRVNGRGWRCSQPTLVGYSLCEHHLGKGRMRSAAAAAAARGRLGRTEHVARIPVVAVVPPPLPPKAEAPASLPPC